MKRHTSSILAGILLLLTACAPAAASPTAAPTEVPEPTATPQPVTLKVGILGYMSNSPLFIAQEEGYFGEQDLQVELVDFGFTERDMVPAGIQGQIDVMAVSTNVGLLSAIEQGANVRYVADKGFANPSGCSSDGFLASKSMLDSGALAEPSGLRGKKVVLFSGNAFEYAHDLMLAKAGLTNDDLQIESVFDAAARNEGLGAGTIDVTVHGEPWITRARDAGVGDLWLPLSELLPNASIAGIVYGPGMLDRPEDLGVRFMAAYLKGVGHFLNDRSDRTVEIIAEYTHLSPEEIRGVCWNSIHPDGKIDPDGLAGFLAWAHDKGYTETELRIDQVWDPRFVVQAYPQLGNN